MSYIGRKIKLLKGKPEVELLLTDLVLCVKTIVGDEREEDISCDSHYMKAVMNRLGIVMRQKFWWVKSETKMYVVMDNAGGHGTDEAKKEYETVLNEKYNIHIIWQIPRSPYTNLLDLGVWCALQARVEKEHKGKRCDTTSLTNSIYRTWGNHTLDEVISKVNKRLEKVLHLIKEGEGSNELVESKRGKKYLSLDTYQIIETGAEIIKKIEEKSERQNGIRSLDDLVENTLVEDNL